MYMHSTSLPGEAPATQAGPAALVFRTALQGALQLGWRNRRIRLDQDAWLVLDGREACSVQAEPEGRVELLTVAVSQGELAAAALAFEATATAAASGGFTIGEPNPFGASAFADSLRPIDGPVGRRLRAIADGRAGGRPPGAEHGDRVALVRDAIDEELALRRKAARIECVKLATREQLLRRILLAADFIASHHDEPISLAEMARAASLSRFHFVRLFRLVHGETPHAFLLKKRTAVARRHLAVGSACSDAATRAGFGSRSALFRNLRKTPPHGGGHEPCFLSA
ncbi:MAG: helix-turn-helix domain-containing protein [Caldimonas sp.]